MILVAAAFAWMTAIGGVIAWAYAHGGKQPEPPQISVRLSVDSDRLTRAVAAAQRDIDALERK